MSQLIDRLLFFKKYQGKFADGHGVNTDESRAWEDTYRSRWESEKIVRSTHGVNCTGSCSWKIYVKSGLVTWETQQTDYPRTRPDMPNHEPRGCPRGASYSWYLYSSNRIRYPLVRKQLVALWREKRKTLDAVSAWKAIQDTPETRRSYQKQRGLGGFVRVSWDEANELIAAANIHTIRKWGPDRVVGFSPIPAMSMLSYAAGTRYLSLLGATCLSFYDWYCDLPPASPQTFGDQTDVPESLDWYNSGYLLVWGSNVSMTRTPDAHFYTEARYRGAKSVVIAPDYVEVAKFADLWLHPRQGTDSALALGMAHVILREFYLERQVPYFQDYAARYTDLPFLVMLEPAQDGASKPGRILRAADLAEARYQTTEADWKPLVWDAGHNCPAMPRGSAGFRWEKGGRWNLEPFDAVTGEPLTPALSLAGNAEQATVLFPYFGNEGRFGLNEAAPVKASTVPVRSVTLRTGETVRCATVFDLMVAHYGLSANPEEWPDYNANVPGTPAWQEHITGVPRDRCIAVARGFARNAEATQGRSMVILGAGLNHWYNMDMTYRAILNMLILCGCIGQNGGGWAHYVGQEKLRPSAGWGPVAFAGDWGGPPRRMNGTSFFYAHTDQWRYEQMTPQAQLSPLASSVTWPRTVLDCNIQAERMGWLPSAPQLTTNPLDVGKAARASGQDPVAYVKEALFSGKVKLACEDPDAPENWPRNMFVWRSNLLGASGKGHEYFMKHLLGAPNNVMNEDSEQRPAFAKWHEQAPEGKLDLLITIDFRMSTTAMFSDIVLPTATWYEKSDLNTSDMHTFIHPLQAAVNPAWEARTDWSIFRGLAEAFQRLAPGTLGEETDVVFSPLQKDTPAELAQPYGGTDWQMDKSFAPEPGKTMPQITLVSRRYDEVYDRYITLGPVLENKGNADHGLNWDTATEITELKQTHPSVSRKYPERSSLFQDTDAVETVLMLAPETNGDVSARSWKALSEKTGRDMSHRLGGREGDRITFADIITQPRQVINSPVWSGVSSTQEAYTANWLNVHEYVPWRTLTGRLQFYQDHPWLRDFGETFATYKPPVETYSTPDALGAEHSNGNPVISLNFLTPHQKWGIHSTYAENLIMLTLGRGGPVVWISEEDAARLHVADNDWVEAFNCNGTLVARAVVSQRIPAGAAFMYHAAERTANVPGSEITGKRAGIHNSVTRVVMKPTHMVGGYAHLSWSFNYYGPVGSNRDEFIFLRKMNKVNWFDGTDKGQEKSV
ncbi:nitrate reductase subunit alpha [Acetobacter cerevisiae]|uniref:Nitrate reductase n=1 Tax=Acetobacter cerevisiae TaxID=178900 RepID=A0A149V6R9_9PROT|nr:nitrate reductase subunit alpha [Acetobacter cerevisiae]KXV75835.1 nitrate reductase [Acetobacter cerevisiae]